MILLRVISISLLFNLNYIENISINKYSNSESTVTFNKKKNDSLSIDSITVYTALIIKKPIYSPAYFYQDSLHCNYDTLKKKASEKGQIYRSQNCKLLIDSIEFSLTKIKIFNEILKGNAANSINSQGNNKCQFDFEISDLFEIHIGSKTIRIGMLGDNSHTCNIEGLTCKIPKKNQLFNLLYKYRNISRQ